MTKLHPGLTLVLAISSLIFTVSCGNLQNITAAQSPLPAVSQTASPDRASVPCRTISHQAGMTEVCGQPDTIVVLGPNLLELGLALGVQPAGFADHMALHSGDYTNPSEQIPYIGDRVTTQPINLGLDSAPSLEAIVQLQPDLILATEMNAAQYQQLSDIAPTLLLEWFDAETNLKAIAQAVNRSDQAERLIAASKQQIETARATFAPTVAAHPNILMLSSGNAQEFHLVTHKNSFCGALIQQLGFHLVYPADMTESTLSTIPQIALETLPKLDRADTVILLGHNWDAQPLTNSHAFAGHQLNTLTQGWEKNAIAQSLSASKTGRVYFIPAYLCLGLPGPIGTELYLNELETQLLSSTQPTP